MRALLSAPGSRRVALCVAALLAGAALIAILRASSSPRVGLQLAGLMLALLAVGTLARRPRFPRLCAFPLAFWISPTVCIAVVVTASLLDLNGSSSAMLSRYIDRAPPTLGIVAGSPKAIRSDEWSVQTPWILSQIHQHPPFPLRNVAVGAGYATCSAIFPWPTGQPCSGPKCGRFSHAHAALTAAAADVTAPIFHLAFSDSIKVEMPPGEEWLQKLKVSGVVLADQSGKTLPIGFRAAGTISGCRFAIRERSAKGF